MLSARAGGLVSVGLAAGALGAYAALMALIFSFRVGVSMSVPGWVALAAPGLLYPLLALVSLSGVGLVARLGAVAALGVAHAVIVAMTGALVAGLTGLPYATAVLEASLRFLPAPILQLFAAPVALLPFRGLLVPRSRRGRERAPRRQPEAERARPRQEAVPGWEVMPRLDTVRPGPESRVSVAAPPAVAAAAVPRVAPPVMVAPPAAAVTARVAEPVALRPVPPAAPAPEETARAYPPSRAREEALVAIPFGRVAEQLPGELFAIPLDDVGARLDEPGHLRVPHRVVLSQLAEGVVTVGWDEVADQFPADVFATRASAMRERLHEGRIVLPLDELVRRLPADVFVLTTAAPDVAGLESFPLPFQPVSADGGEEAAASDAAAPAGDGLPGEAISLVREESEGAAEASAADATPAASEEAPAPVPAIPESEPAARALAAEEHTAAPISAELPDEPRPPVVEAEASADVAPAAEELRAAAEESRAAAEESLAVAEESPAPATVLELGEVGATGPAVAEAAALAPFGAPAASSPGVSDEDRARIDRLAGALAPMGPLIASVSAGLHVFRSPSLPLEAVIRAAAPVMPLLAEGPWLVDQLTVRLEAGAMVLTPLAPEDPGPALLVVSPPRAGALALLEILSLRARASESPCRPAPRADARGPLEELIPVAGGPAADLLAGALGAVGAFTPSVLRDPTGCVELCLLLPPGEDARGVGSFAHAACRALAASAADGALGPVQSAVFKLGPRRLALRRMEGRPGHWIALLTSGEGGRPGRVHLEMERATARVGAR